MLSEALDITISSHGTSILINLSGPFHKEQVPNIKTRIEHLIRDGNFDFIIDLEKVTIFHESVAPMFLTLLNLVKGKHGDIKLIFRNDAAYKAFSAYRNIFSVFPDLQNMSGNRLLNSLKKRGKLLTKKTGIRISLPVALFLLFLITGWFISLGIIINMQKKQISSLETELRSTREWKKRTELQLVEMQNRLKPLKQLGLLPDSLSDH